MASTDTGARTATTTPTPLAQRSPAPDVARGMMLLLIVVANAPFYLWAADKGGFGSHPLDGGVADRVVQTIALVAVDGRTYPMFAFLFGYGIAQLYRRQHEAGVPHDQARRLLRRRHWWMLAFGAVHATLLWFGDVIGAYGLAGLVLVALFIDRREKTIKVWIGVFTGLLVVGLLLTVAGAVLTGVFAPEEASSGDFAIPEVAAIENPFIAALARLGFWAVLFPMQGLFMLVTPVAVLVAFLAARHRVLERPAEHLPLLRRTAVVGIGTGWATGLVCALQNLDLLGIDRSLDWGFLMVQSVGGLAGGLGYAALFGVLAARWGERRGPVVTALQAVGRRSMTCYLAQSVVFAPLMSAWGVGLGEHLTSWTIFLVAVATWLATVALAVALERAGRRGPAETLLRKLSYPRPREITLP
jgi:uncharacterized protein